MKWINSGFYSLVNHKRNRTPVKIKQMQLVDRNKYSPLECDRKRKEKARGGEEEVRATGAVFSAKTN